MSGGAQINSSNGLNAFLTVIGGATLLFGGIWLLGRLLASARTMNPEKVTVEDNGKPIYDTEAVEVPNAAPAKPTEAPIPSTALAVVENTPPPVAVGPVFDHSPDFRMVKVDGTQYSLTMTESREKEWGQVLGLQLAIEGLYYPHGTSATF